MDLKIQTMNELEEIIKVSQRELNSIFKKPRCTPKLLSKPPFRFIHDIVTAIIAATSFPEKYFSFEELDSKQFTSKTSKVGFIEKVIRLASACRKTELKVQAVKVVSGKEPIHTNVLLIALARAASDPSLDRETIVHECLRSDLQRDGKYEIEDSQGTTTELVNSPKREGKNEESITHSIEGVKLTTPHTQSSIAISQEKELLIKEVKMCNGDTSRTREFLDKIVSKPRCTEKLLQKPPFRFLHDLIMAIIMNTSFGLNLYSVTEQDSSKIKDKYSKIDFLAKIISLVKASLGIDIDIQPKKVVTGLEPEKTNYFLQLLVIAATNRTVHKKEHKKISNNGNATENETSDTMDREKHTNKSDIAQKHEPDSLIASEQGQFDRYNLLSSDICKSEEDNDAHIDLADNEDLIHTGQTYNTLQERIKECNTDRGRTGEMIQKLITKPRCIEKLLKRPPFRFLHDVFMAIADQTHLKLEMLSEDEKNSANVKEKTDKILFLDKIIGFVEAALNTKIDASPAKIVSGLESEKTCHFLQLFVIAATFQNEDGQKDNFESEEKKNENKDIICIHKPEIPLNEIKKVEQNIKDEKNQEKEEDTEELKERDDQDPVAFSTEVTTRICNNAKSPFGQISGEEEESPADESKYKDNSSKTSSSNKVNLNESNVPENRMFDPKETEEERHEGDFLKDNESLIAKGDNGKTTDLGYNSTKIIVLNEKKKEFASEIISEVDCFKMPDYVRPATARKRPPRIKNTTENQSLDQRLHQNKHTHTIIKEEEDVDEEKKADENNLNVILKSKYREKDSPTDILEEIDGDKTKNSIQETKKKGIRLKLNLSKNNRLFATSSREIESNQQLHVPSNQNLNIESVGNSIQRIVKYSSVAGKCMGHVNNDVLHMMKERTAWEREYRHNLENKPSKHNDMDHLHQTIASLDNQIKQKKLRIERMRCNICKNEEKINYYMQLIMKNS